jgi:small subunit ribosomal protein S17
MSENETTDTTETDPHAEAVTEPPEPQAPEETPAADETPAAEDTPAADETPAAEEAPTAEAAPAVAATPAAEEAGTSAPSQRAKPSRSNRHVPRSERRQRPRKLRARPTGERSTITRQPKPEHERGRRQERRGVVVSDAMDKTIVVRVDAVKAHPRYKKVVRRSVKFHAHDARNEAKVGDLVRIVETRPLSKTKNWRLAEVLEAAK